MDGPMGPPPLGGDQSRGSDILATSLATVLIATVLTALRFGTRIGVVRQWGWDDATILLAWVGSTTFFLKLRLGKMDEPLLASLSRTFTDRTQTGLLMGPYSIRPPPDLKWRWSACILSQS